MKRSGVVFESGVMIASGDVWVGTPVCQWPTIQHHHHRWENQHNRGAEIQKYRSTGWKPKLKLDDDDRGRIW